MAGYVLTITLATAAYFAWPPGRPVTWALFVVCVAAAVVADTVTHRRALRRERVLRVAGVSLASATSLEDVAAAAQAAARTLTGENGQRDAVLALREEGMLHGPLPDCPAKPAHTAAPAGAVSGSHGAAGSPSVATPRPFSQTLSVAEPAPGTQAAAAHPAAQVNGMSVVPPSRARATLRLIRASADGPVMPATSVAAWLSLAAGPAPRLLTPGQPEHKEAGKLAVGTSVMLCPLVLKDQPAGEPPLGILAVFGPSRSLTALTEALEILAALTALAVERVTLSQEVSRRNSEAYFRTLVQDTSDIILIIEDDGLIRYATPSAAGLFGQVAAGAYLADLIPPQQRAEVAQSFTRMRERAGGVSTHDGWRITRADGTPAEVEVRCSDLRQDPTVGGLVLTLRDVTEQRKLERELTHRAFHDPLTGLPNRLLFTDRIGHALARARRSGNTVGILFVDLDDFKMVNDTMGHGAGDELLVAAANRLSALARESDTAARLGGDEFAVLVEEATDGTAVEKFAERIVRAFGDRFDVAGGSVVTTATVGISTTEDSADAADLIRHADLALYAAKAAGKRQWRRYQPVLSIGVTKRRELQAAIGDAVANASFTLVYQPIVMLATGEIAGFEALLRWPHPRWGMIRPDQFITIAEETGHIVPLGAWVLEQAATDTMRWQQRTGRQAPLYVSVNVSARQFANPGFVASVQRVLKSSGLAPSSLLLELTESVLLRRDDRIRSDLAELKRLGVRLAIDDFGTGYSSLGYLRELPMDVLKIDKSFVEGIAVSEQRLAIVEVIIRIAKTLGLTVMAEGIESEVQLHLLMSLGCRYGQGYLLERPVGASEAEALVAAGAVSELPATSM